MEEDRRHLLAIIIAIMAGCGIAASSIPFLSSLWPTAATLAQAKESVEVDLTHLVPGDRKSVV